MTTAYEIPFTPEPQSFVIALAGRSYRLRTAWCQPAEAWMLDVLDADNIPMVVGLPIVPGVDLLGQYPHLNFGGRIFAQSAGDPRVVPGFNDLGAGGLVFFVTEP